jgi:phosphoketolase
MSAGPLAPDELRRLDAFWRAANYLSVGQIYLLDNPLLREPLALEHVKPRLLGHWGTTPTPASCGSSPATSARARRWPPSTAAARSTPRWASPRSRGS